MAFNSTTPWVFSALRLNNTVHSHVQEGLLASAFIVTPKMQHNTATDYRGTTGITTREVGRAQLRHCCFAFFSPQNVRKVQDSLFCRIIACAAQCNQYSDSNIYWNTTTKCTIFSDLTMLLKVTNLTMLLNAKTLFSRFFNLNG